MEDIEKIEIVRTEGENCRLTITPTRITIKIPLSYTEEEVDISTEHLVLRAQEIGEVYVAHREKFNLRKSLKWIRDNPGKEWQVSIKRNNKWKIK